MYDVTIKIVEFLNLSELELKVRNHSSNNMLLIRIRNYHTQEKIVSHVLFEKCWSSSTKY